VLIIIYSVYSLYYLVPFSSYSRFKPENSSLFQPYPCFTVWRSRPGESARINGWNLCRKN